MMRLSAQMASRLEGISRQKGDLAFQDVTGRVAQTLLSLAKEPDAMTHPDGMQIKISREEIGQIVGCSRETVGRVLKMFEEQQLISAHGKTIVVYGTRQFSANLIQEGFLQGGGMDPTIEWFLSHC